MKNSLAVIIATKDRHKDIRALLESIRSQERHPDQIIIVDAGMPCDIFLDEYRDLPIDFISHRPPSLTAQRNAGIKKIRDGITVAAFLDDDVVLENGALKTVMDFFDSSSGNVGGAGLNNICESARRTSVLQRAFFITSDKPGEVLASGFQSRPFPLNGATPVQWIPGYAMIFRRKVLEEFKFDEWFGGYARFEDADLTYRVSRKYDLFVLQDARIRHPARLEAVDFSRALGAMEVVNKVYFVKKNTGLSMTLCIWALCGYTLNNLVKGVFTLNKRYFLRACGNLSGFIQLIFKGMP